MTDMIAGEAALAALLTDLYGLKGRLVPLPGEHDLNFRVEAEDGRRYLLKLHAAGDEESLAMQVAVLEHLHRAAPELLVSRQIPARGGALLTPVSFRGERQARLLTWIEGDVWAGSRARSRDSVTTLGALLGRLDRALADFFHPGARRVYGWDIARADHLRRHVDLVEGAEKQAAVIAILDRFRSVVKPALDACPRQVIHNDANDYNTVLDAAGRVSGLLDFGDMVETARIIEVAVAAAYALIGSDDPVGVIADLAAAYHAVNPLTEAEASLVFDLVRLRYAVSILMATKQIREQPDNRYLLVSQEDVWRELKRLEAENAAFARMRIRDACGFAAVASARRIARWLEANAQGFAAPIRVEGREPVVTRLDLSAESPEADRLGTLDAAAFDRFVTERLQSAGADLAIGAYGEERVVPGMGSGDAERPLHHRTIHLGIDLYAAAGTPVRAVLAGSVAFLNDDAVENGFGPTVLLRHETGEGDVFFTLYGHLSRASLSGLKPGQHVGAGEVIGRLGALSENGGWAPHLHIQLVTDHLGLEGRMVGNGSRAAWQIWQQVSPDPSVLLGLPVAASRIPPMSSEFLVRERQRRIGRSLSIAYNPRPLKIVAAEGCHLIDEEGVRWLDMVNNVCHVGHCHPRVVAAARQQMGVLNTNSRYLHDTLVEYARRLTALFPEPLSVCFFVNSGSEANDLAIRLARAHTGHHDLITVDHAYHGHLTSLIDVSPYKFNGRGGEGRPAHVRVAEMPDLYRGRFRYGDPAAGEKYAEDVRRQVAALAAEGRAPALFFSEGILGTGGQLPLPAGYLRAAYAHVRAAGGLCLADEVQVGFGRVGSHMWAFETQGVVPDIVTMGKPIGNGHPMAAVITTPEIAASFANGMEYFNTFGGNPVSASIGLAVLDVIRDERLQHHCLRIGDRLMAGARALADRHSVIGDVRGHGLFIGIEMVHDRQTLAPAADAVDFLLVEMKEKHHILLSSEGPLHNVLKIKPPAPFGEADCDRFLDALDEVLTRFSRGERA
ncbi:aminotransferase class III-fold pyridoxal phosphate-dependent enzyme [Gellertiella hungarica]|uniref:4-aminobutyrate aminotransferase-like enzyme/Ser/Thr protein kinase RdoA (MazF antagonist) n=1 Tax=Gellertiella hungarica TaxID=1572859 RepID=A0A7W6J1A5_9HYPH|nr:aminotransferase class III-fold pyridoxal phosphate-dependent enzyme [Gellertiella hungarica]MBB4062907.1 4-aminobutyrate aminotransferase-like enzyme/Ser/Thr protein kinase RdoA (MazF antagonist) [Gellertiella hungarica]